MHRRLIRWCLAPLVVAVIGASVAMAATAATSSSTSGVVRVAHSSKYGMVLVTSTGMTLYRFTPDPKGKSTCAGACAAIWPALTVAGSAKPSVGTGANASLIGTIKHSNGSRQVTYGGFPLYRYSGDSKPGQTNGEGKFGKWYVVNSKGALVKKAASGGGGGSWG